MKSAAPFLFSVLIAATSFFQPAFAVNEGLIIDFLVEEKGSTLMQSARIQDGMIVVKQMGGAPEVDMLFDSASMALFIINHQSNSYYKIDQGVIKKASLMFASLAAVDEPQEGVLSDLLSTFGLLKSKEKEQSLIEIMKTDSILSAVDIKCQLFRQFKNDRLESELCIAPKQRLEILGEHYQTLALFYQFGDGLMNRAGGVLENIGIGMPRLSTMGEDGLPVLAYVISQKLKISVVKIESGNSEKSIFLLPDDYSQTPIPFIG